MAGSPERMCIDDQICAHVLLINFKGDKGLNNEPSAPIVEHADIEMCVHGFQVNFK